MPSPVGHALAGLAAGWTIRGAPSPPRHASVAREALLFASLGALADIDLLFGPHRGPTHGIGAALLVGIAAYSIWPSTMAGRLAGAAACAAAYGTHILLDWLGSDTAPPRGVMALWPFSLEYYVSAHPVFLSVTREYWHGDYFWRGNLNALIRELLILLPLLAFVVLARLRTGRKLTELRRHGRPP